MTDSCEDGDYVIVEEGGSCTECDSIVEDGTCLCGFSRTKENCEDSPKLEPIAVYYSFGAGEENGAVTMRKEVGHADYREPLVRLSDVIEWLKSKRSEYDEEVRAAQKIGLEHREYRFASYRGTVKELIEELREFTQKTEADSN